MVCRHDVGGVKVVVSGPRLKYSVISGVDMAAILQREYLQRWDHDVHERERRDADQFPLYVGVKSHATELSNGIHPC